MNISTTGSVFVSFFFSFFPFYVLNMYFFLKEKLDGFMIYLHELRGKVNEMESQYFLSLWLKSVQWGFIMPRC